MADNINNLDKFFKSTLANHAVNPEPEVWEKLSSRLDNKEKAVILIWWKWVAAAAVVLISFWLMYQLDDQRLKNIASVSVSDTEFIEKTPFSISPTQKIIEKEKTIDKTTEAKTPAGALEIKAPNSDLTKKEGKAEIFTVVKKEKPTIKRIREQFPEILEEIDAPKRDRLTVPIINQHAFHPAIALVEEVKKYPPNDYKVKIVSNGYAIQPEKEKLVKGLENKIGGFFTKVDEGFGGLQDAKNNLFASLTTKRDKKKKLTN